MKEGFTPKNKDVSRSTLQDILQGKIRISCGILGEILAYRIWSTYRSHVQDNILGRPATTNQNVPTRGGLNRLGLIIHRTRDQSGLAGMTYARAARPFRWNVARFGQFQQALVARSPEDRQAGSCKFYPGSLISRRWRLVRRSRR